MRLAASSQTMPNLAHQRMTLLADKEIAIGRKLPAQRVIEPARIVVGESVERLTDPGLSHGSFNRSLIKYIGRPLTSS